MFTEQIGFDSINALKLPTAELPTKIVAIHLSAARDHALTFIVIIFINQRQRHNRNQRNADDFCVAVVFHERLQRAHDQQNSVADPNRIDRVRLNILNAADETILNVELRILQNQENDTHTSKCQESHKNP